MNLTHFWIALRYLKGRKGQFLSMNARLALTGVFVGTSLLVVVISVLNGFQTQLKKSIFGFDPHITLSRFEKGASTPIQDWHEWKTQIQEKMGDEITSVEGFIQSPAILRSRSNIDHVFVRSMEFLPGKDKSVLHTPDFFPPLEQPVDAQEFPASGSVFIGRELALNLGIFLGDRIELIVPRGQFSLKLGVTPSMKSYRVAGLFKTGNYTYDSRVVILPLSEGQKLFQIGNSVQQIVVRVKNTERLSHITSLFYQIWPYSLRNIEDEQRNFFAALKLEKTIISTIVFLFILVGVVGIIVSTWNLVRSHRKDIGISKALGMSDGNILSIYTLSGFLLGSVGSILGILTGVFLSLHLEKILNSIELFINSIGEHIASAQGGVWINIQLIPTGVYYFDHLPVFIDISFLHLLGVVSIFLSGMASMIPAWAASRYEPVKIIRGGEQ